MAHRTLLSSLFVTWAFCSATLGTNGFLDAWVLEYPASTLPARMLALTGMSCNVCHHAGPGVQGNCYRETLAAYVVQGSSMEEAIALADTDDSDLDGVPNGVEIMTAREGEPGQIGYNPGLVGDTGTDPCGDPPNEVVTGVPETPASWCGDGEVNQPTEECDPPGETATCPDGGVCRADCTCPPPVPALSEWGLRGMTLLLLVFGSVVITRRHSAA